MRTRLPLARQTEQVGEVDGSKPKSRKFLEHLMPLRGPLQRYAERMLRDRGGVEDALQTAITQSFSDFDRYAEGTNFRAWIFRYLTNEIYNRNRSKAGSSTDESPEEIAGADPWLKREQQDAFDRVLENPDSVLEQFEDSVGAALRGLSHLERTTLLLRAIGEFSYREIADVLQIPLGSVMGYLSRARMTLRERLAQYAVERGLIRSDQREPQP